jgi:uncharacterized surface protein with fasciclin (FAS1) repeats
MWKTALTTFAVLVGLSILPGTGSARHWHHGHDNLTLADLVAGSDKFSTLNAALTFTGLDAALADPNAQLTAFLPTNRAFDRTLGKLGLEASDLLTEENKGLLTDILLYHVLPGVATRQDVISLDGDAVVPLQGDEIAIDVSFSWFIRLNGTVFVTYADIPAANGVAHVISGVLLPPSIFGGENTIYDRLNRSQRFSTLVAALEFTGLDAVLDDPANEFTLLAPSNYAFRRTLAPLGLTPADLLTEANKQLTTDILLYHVLEGEARASDIRAADGQEVPTVFGDTISVHARGPFIFLNGRVWVWKTNLDTSNGVIHVLNRVLLPPSLGLN